MYGFNLLGVNSHDSRIHRSSKNIDSILEGASPEFDSFKEIEEAIKKLQAQGDPSVALKEYLNSSDATQQISSAVESAVSGKNYATEDSLKDYAKITDIPKAYDDSEVKTLIEGKADLGHTHSEYAKASEIPTTLPASDVPDWAKAAEKPAYTADEVGAMPASTAIPTKISDLEGSSELVKSGDISDWAKADSQSTVTLEATTETGEVITFTLIGSKNV